MLSKNIIKNKWLEIFILSMLIIRNCSIMPYDQLAIIIDHS